MACDSSACQSGCYKDRSLNGVEEHEHSQLVRNNGELPNGASTRGSNSSSLICVKCKVNRTMAAVEAEQSLHGGDASKFCADCFRSNIFGKFRFAVTSNALISPSDNVLVAFSGGPSSRVALQFLHNMQVKAQSNFDASRDKLLSVFGVGVALVDESAAFVGQEFHNLIEEIKVIVSNLAPPVKQFHVIPIESIYSSESADGRNKLKAMLNSVSDSTGREDLLKHLRTLSLQKFALENGYTKVLLGTCTSKIACHVLEATVKGQGYSLAGDIQYVDVRWEVPMVLPLRDCLAEELNLICSLDGMKTVDLFHGFSSGINGLIASFVKLLQEDNPSRESTIVRTAGKLTPFHFNKMPEADDCKDQLASRRRQKKYNLKNNDSLPPESFCPICYSPLNDFDLNNSNGKSENEETVFTEYMIKVCCSSCRFQILPGDNSVLEEFCDLLPPPVVARARYSRSSSNHGCCLRDQIEDCLLSDSEDGS